MKKYIFFLLSALFVFFSSCSIEKRHYLPGYHVQWNNKSKARNFAKEKLANESAKDVIESSSLQEESLDESFFAGGSNSSPIVQVKQKTKRVFNVDCDTLFLRDKKFIKAKVVEITQRKVRYKLCNNVNDSIYEKFKDKITMIKYDDGRMETFKLSYESDEYSKKQFNDNFNNGASSGKRLLKSFLVFLLILIIVSAIAFASSFIY